MDKMGFKETGFASSCSGQGHSNKPSSSIKATHFGKLSNFKDYTPWNFLVDVVHVTNMADEHLEMY
jgi:hypothetical protein